MSVHAHIDFDRRTGRPLEGTLEAVETLTDAELEREITIAALANRRAQRFAALLEERRQRQQRIRGGGVSP